MSTWQDYLVDDDAGLARIFREARSIAVLGATNDRSRPAYYVPAYLKSSGYLVQGVNPILEGEEVFGEPVVATLADLPEPVDVIVEALGGVEPAYSLVRGALDRGIPVITANKSLIAAHGDELSQVARRRATALRFEASCIAGVPFLGMFERRPLSARAEPR